MTWLLYALIAHAHAKCIFLDLNNAPQEYGACMDAAGENNIHVVSSTVNGGHQIGKNALSHAIDQLEATGQTVDCLIVSGHDGSGHFFGDGGQLYAADLKKVIDAHPKTKKTLVSMALMGCYPNSVHGAQTFWLRPNENVRQTFGFPVQSPTKFSADSAKLVGAYCKNHAEWVKASSAEELCKIYPSIKKLTGQTVSLATCEAVASHAYGDKTCYTYDEMNRMCHDFDPGDRNADMYGAYFSADGCDPRYNNPPRDVNSAYEGGASALRDYYNKIHIWRHCTDQLRADRGYQMPYPPQVIRLIKYDDIKTNIARLNRREIAEYDQRLRDLCLDQFTLGEITKLNRQQMNERIEGAVRALESNPDDDYGGFTSMIDGSRSRAPASVGLLVDGDEPTPQRTSKLPREASIAPTRMEPTERPNRCDLLQDEPAPAPVCRSKRTNPEVVARMAKLMKATFVDLNYYDKTNGKFRMCSHFHLVEPNASERFKSQCIVDYRTAASI